MIQQVMTNPGEIIFREVPVPEVGDDQVLVKIMNIGICGSDIHVYHGKHPFTKYPVTQGHEVSGEITELGKNVTGFQVGQKVTIEPQVYCGHCYPCRHGKYNLCEELKVMGFQTTGTASEYFAVDASKVTPIPEEMSYEEGAMIEPLAVGIHAARRGEVDNSKTVLITGVGCIGLMTLLACKAMNAQKIIVSDVFDNRLEKALELGADYAINVAKEDLATRVKELTDGNGPDIILETSGNAKSIAANVYAIRRGGVIVQVDTCADPVPYQFNELGKIEADIRSVFRYRNIFPLAIKLIEKGDIDLKAVGPNIFDFEDVAEAFDTAINKGNEVVKCILKF